MKYAFLALLILSLVSCSSSLKKGVILTTQEQFDIIAVRCPDGTRIRPVLAVDGRGPSGVLIRGSSKILQSGDAVIVKLCDDKPWKIGIVEFFDGKPVVFREYMKYTPVN